MLAFIAGFAGCAAPAPYMAPFKKSVTPLGSATAFASAGGASDFNPRATA